MKTRIITHRGLDPDRAPYYKESSFQAFKDQLQRGYGLEFDVRFTADGKMVAIHDKNLERLTSGTDKRLVSEVTAKELLAMSFDGNHLISIPSLLDLNRFMLETGNLSAIHLKAQHQVKVQMDAVLEAIRLSGGPEEYIIFDVSITAALYIKNKYPELALAASVSHPYDIERYNGVVGGTLLTLEELIVHKDLFSWAWLDEWDLTDKDGGKKSLYNNETFEQLRQEGLKIALVTPELHGTSPGLLGGEAHPDASTRERLNTRLAEIVELQPDAICTDHPDYVRALLRG